MWIKSLVVLCIVGIISTLFAVDITGFRDMKWGDSPAALGPQAKLSWEDKARNATGYTRTNEKLTIGDVPLWEISYTFFDNKLYKIKFTSNKYIHESEIDYAFQTVKTAFIAKYGKWTNETDGFGHAYEWQRSRKDNTKIRIHADPIDNNGAWIRGEILNELIYDKEIEYVNNKLKNDL